MNASIKYWSVFAIVLCLTACGGSNNKKETTITPPPTTVFDIAVAKGNFTTLVAALQATDLDDVLDDPNGSYTLFAPTDAAFAVLGTETINALLADKATLSNILLYHVISGNEVMSTAAIASAGMTVTMANQQNVGLSLSGSSLLINTAMVTVVDLKADNGVVHVIDAVLTPPAIKGTPTNNIVETAVAAGNFSTLVTALQTAGLDTLLADETKTFTVFAPTDAAFAMVGEANINALLGDSDALNAVLLQHVIANAEVNSIGAYAANGTNIETASGAMIPVSIENRILRIGGAAVTMADIYTTNGVIHVIDTVIVGDVELPAPPMSIVDTARAAGNFTTLIAALEATGLDTVLADLEGSFTVFAPTDEAFSALGQDTINALLADTDALSDILLYHVIAGNEILADAAIAVAAGENSLVEMAKGKKTGLSLNGQNLFINLSQVTTANVLTDNGVIHVLDKVLLPPTAKGTPTDNIVETAIAAGNFTTLVTALQTAGLDATLANESETFTVFAPTDAAFALIPEATLNALMADTPALTQVLLQHVIIGAEVDSVTAFTLNGMQVDTASGEDVTIAIVNGNLEVQGSIVSMFDIYTTNGVIHVIDTVITETLQ